MKVLDLKARLEYSHAAVAVLRTLRLTDTTMRYASLREL